MGYLQRVKLLAALQKVIADKPEQSDKLLQFKKMLYDYTVEAGDVIKFPKQKTGTDFLKESTHLEKIEKEIAEQEFPIDRILLNLIQHRRKELQVEINKALKAKGLTS